MARRRLEFPDEFVLSDGTRIRTPEELAERLSRRPDLAGEALRRVAAGEVERWLSQTGWGPSGQRVAALRQKKGGFEAAQVVAALLGQELPESCESAEPAPARGDDAEPEGDGFAAEPAEGAQEVPSGEPPSESSEDEPGGSEGSASRPGRAPVGDLIERQRRAVRGFLALEERRRQGEESATANLRRHEGEARRRAESALTQAEQLVAGARDRSRQAFERLGEAGLPSSQELEANSTVGTLGAEATGVRRLTGDLTTKLGELAQLRERVRDRNAFLIRAGAVLGASALLIGLAIWTSRKEEREAGGQAENPAVAAQAGETGETENSAASGGSVSGTRQSGAAPESSSGQSGSGAGATRAKKGVAAGSSNRAPAGGGSATPAPVVPATGTLEIRTNVYDDSVTLDGRLLGPSPQVVEVRPGRHTVMARKADCADAVTQVEVAAGAREVVRLELLCITAGDLVARAQALFEAGEYDRALAKVGSALEMSPGFRPALELRRQIEATKAILQGRTGEGR